MTYQLTGEYENQKRFTQTMIWVFPLVLLIIFVLLFMVFRSGMEAAHVMLAVPFALSGGMILSLLHILIVTPVIFFWLRERQLKRP